MAHTMYCMLWIHIKNTAIHKIWPTAVSIYGSPIWTACYLFHSNLCCECPQGKMVQICMINYTNQPTPLACQILSCFVSWRIPSLTLHTHLWFKRKPISKESSFSNGPWSDLKSKCVGPNSPLTQVGETQLILMPHYRITEFGVLEFSPLLCFFPQENYTAFWLAITATGRHYPRCLIGMIL